MYRHLLIATDGSAFAQKAVTQGLELAKILNARVTAVTVSEPIASMVVGSATIALPIAEFRTAMDVAAAEILTEVSALAKTMGVPCDVLHVKEHYPAEGLIEAANAKGADLIVMASHGRRGLSKLVLGSQATRVLSHCSIPVLICR
jgi:nucleotide-binding universal stress UspA family protein